MSGIILANKSFFNGMVRLQNFGSGHFDVYCRWLQDGDLLRETCTEEPFTLADCQALLARCNAGTAIVQVIYYDDSAVGDISLFLDSSGVGEINFMIAEQRCRRQGIMKTALADFIAELPSSITMVKAVVHKGNAGSKHVLEHVGFQPSFDLEVPLMEGYEEWQLHRE